MKLGILCAILFLVACGNKEIPNSVSWPVEEFSFTNQNEKQLTLEDLKGKVWVANFIFTNCNNVCLPMTSNMSKLQAQLKEKKIDNVELISFSIDPSVDSPRVLKEYGTKFNANYSNWHFLTGYEQDYIENFAEKSFKTIVRKPETGDQVIHGTDFFLVDEKGMIVKNYNGTDGFPLEEIVKHIKILQDY